MRHRVAARDLVGDIASRMGLSASDVARIFDGAPLDFPVIFTHRLPLLSHLFGMIGITLGARVWLLESARELSPVALLELIRHEAEHVRQQRDSPALFYPRYGLEYLRYLAAPDAATTRGSRAMRAYRSIGYEREAYAAGEEARRIIIASGLIGWG